MLTFIAKNIATIIISAILLCIVIAIIVKLKKDKEKGKSLCGGNCSHCACAGTCHSAGNANANNFTKPQEKNLSSQKDEIVTVVKIDGMVCGMCESHINDVIRNNFKVKKVSSSAKTGEAVITSLQPIDEKLLENVINNTGYKFISIDKR